MPTRHSMLPPPQLDDSSSETGISMLHSVSFAPTPLQQYPSSSIPIPNRVNNKTVPKSDLHVLYSKQFKTNLSIANYHTWHNGAEAHLLQWTSVFVCPWSGELFLSGRYPNAPTEQMVCHNGLYWYTKKMHAEHAAAAHALDCWSIRNDPATLPPFISQEPSYNNSHNESSVFRLPDTVPEAIRDTIYAQQAEIRKERQLPPLM